MVVPVFRPENAASIATVLDLVRPLWTATEGMDNFRIVSFCASAT
jgi:hypothetical protein